MKLRPPKPHDGKCDRKLEIGQVQQTQPYGEGTTVILHAAAYMNDYHIQEKRDCYSRHKVSSSYKTRRYDRRKADRQDATGLRHKAGGMELVKHRKSQPSCVRICGRYDAFESVKKARLTSMGKEAATHTS